MANVVIEFDKPNKEKICRFTVRNCPNEHVAWLSAGDEIGFDLVESKEFFYLTVSRKVCLMGQQQPIYVICVPQVFDNLEEATSIVEKFFIQFGENLVIDPHLDLPQEHIPEV